jgi:hypothetical protein
MRISAELLVIVVVSMALAIWFSIRLHWSVGAMYVAGLLWTIVDEKLLGAGTNAKPG